MRKSLNSAKTRCTLAGTRVLDNPKPRSRTRTRLTVRTRACLKSCKSFTTTGPSTWSKRSRRLLAMRPLRSGLARTSTSGSGWPAKPKTRKGDRSGQPEARRIQTGTANSGAAEGVLPGASRIRTGSEPSGAELSNEESGHIGDDIMAHYVGGMICVICESPIDRGRLTRWPWARTCSRRCSDLNAAESGRRARRAYRRRRRRAAAAMNEARHA